MKAHKQINNNYVKVMVKMTREREGGERERERDLTKVHEGTHTLFLNFHQCKKGRGWRVNN